MLCVQDADKRGRLQALRCGEEALENKFLGFAAHPGVFYGETTTGERLLNVFRDYIG
jgi:hypothetical protein